MESDSIKVLQISILSKINFAYYDLRQNPSLKLVLDSNGNNEEEKFRNYVSSLNNDELLEFRKTMFKYLKNETIAQSRMMLIINYLYALLVDGNNNKISIYKNFQDKLEDIKNFENRNKEITDKIKTVRDKVFSHIDANWLECVKNISFEEIETCINFLNNLFNYDFKNLLSLCTNN